MTHASLALTQFQVLQRWGRGFLHHSLLLLGSLGDTDSHSLLHVTDSEATKRGILCEGLNTHGLGGLKVNHSSITRLDKLGVILKFLARATIALLLDFNKLAGNVSSVAIQHRCIAILDLTRVIQDDDLGVEGLGAPCGIILAVRSHIATTDVLNRDVLDVESNIVSWDSLWKRLVVHLHRLDLSGHIGRSKGDKHAWFDD